MQTAHLGNYPEPAFRPGPQLATLRPEGSPLEGKDGAPNRLAIMQPYLFPYIGYFQLAAAVDKFVFYDDVNFIKNGWINRNRILMNRKVHYLTVPLSSASSFAKIRDVYIQPRERWINQVFESLRHAYAKAPYYTQTIELIRNVLTADTHHIGVLAAKSVISVSRYLGIRTAFEPTSTIYDNIHMKDVARVLDICARERATEYVNLPGGRGLYASEMFDTANLHLSFIDPDLTAYPQFSSAFEPNLSIIDVLMFNPVDEIRGRLYASVPA